MKKILVEFTLSELARVEVAVRLRAEACQIKDAADESEDEKLVRLAWQKLLVKLMEAT